MRYVFHDTPQPHSWPTAYVSGCRRLPFDLLLLSAQGPPLTPTGQQPVAVEVGQHPQQQRQQRPHAYVPVPQAQPAQTEGEIVRPKGDGLAGGWQA